MTQYYYKKGYCPQCNKQIMVKNAQGLWNSCKSNYRQIDLYQSNGHKFRSIICSDCLAAPDLTLLFNSITGAASEASSRKVLDYIISLGAITKSEEVKRGN